MAFSEGDVVRVTKKQPPIAATVLIAEPDSKGEIAVDVEGGGHYVKESTARIFATAFVPGDSVIVDGVTTGEVLAVDDAGQASVMTGTQGAATLWLGPVADVEHA